MHLSPPGYMEACMLGSAPFQFLLQQETAGSRESHSQWSSKQIVRWACVRGKAGPWCEWVPGHNAQISCLIPFLDKEWHLCLQVSEVFQPFISIELWKWYLHRLLVPSSSCSLLRATCPHVLGALPIPCRWLSSLIEAVRWLWGELHCLAAMPFIKIWKLLNFLLNFQMDSQSQFRYECMKETSHNSRQFLIEHQQLIPEVDVVLTLPA